jgi:hypothetical protein
MCAVTPPARPILLRGQLGVSAAAFLVVGAACLALDLAASRGPLVDGLGFVAMALATPLLGFLPSWRPEGVWLREALPAPAGTRPRIGLGEALSALGASLVVGATAAFVARVAAPEIWPGIVGIFAGTETGLAIILARELVRVERWERAHRRRLLREPVDGGAAPDRYLFIEGVR